MQLTINCLTNGLQKWFYKLPSKVMVSTACPGSNDGFWNRPGWGGGNGVSLVPGLALPSSMILREPPSTPERLRLLL